MSANLTRPQQALAHLKQGGFAKGADWEKAHALCQQDEGDFAHDLVHALCHWIEGDMANRDYWYRRLPGWQRAGTIEAEAEAVAERLGSRV